MARPHRTNSKTMSHNVGLKAHNSQLLFIDDEDRKKFLFYLKRACKRNNVSLVLYCLMDNHVHMILHGEIKNFQNTFQSLGASFCMWYNRKYERSGSVWKDRYYSKPINSRKQFVDTASYIFNNPVKAKITKNCSSYKWSSYRYLDDINNNEVNTKLADCIANITHLKKMTEIRANTATDNSIRIFSKKRKSDAVVRMDIYKFIKNNNASSILEIEESSSRHFLRILLKQGSNYNQLSRILKLSRKQLLHLTS